ncbi:hypothetical protein [Pseudomonas mandelii]|uniref:Uncharacterized protein n=1 Tax=Pseudomonas mandelii TaxID=75612 RepID=A0A502HV28_9PSED|nr:hypothetical protein [Pseudomonas mandelii]TPG77206.1 hypothetical protein EAH74_28230 [Pseudomonas mandelii]
MTYVGAFANSDIHPDLLIITSIHKPPREAVRLCRLSDGLRLTLPPSRVSVIPDGTGAFEEHMAVEIKKARKLSSSIFAPDSPQSEGGSMDEYLEITSLAEASYRLPAITTYVIQQEYKRFSHPKYSVTDCWRHVCLRCDLFGLKRPSLGFVRSRLGVYSGHLFRAELEQRLQGDKYRIKLKQR